MACSRMDGISKTAAVQYGAYSSESGIGSGQSRMHVKRSVDHQLFSLQSLPLKTSDAGLATARMPSPITINLECPEQFTNKLHNHFTK